MRSSIETAYLDPKNEEIKITALFLPLWYLRWVIFVSLAHWFSTSPRTVYTIYWSVDLLFIALSVFSIKGHWTPVGILFMVEELFVFLWHFSQFILWVDYFKGIFKGDGKMSEKNVKVWVWIIFISVMICVLLEIVTWIITIIVGRKIEVIESEDMQLGIDDNVIELNNKVINYNTMKYEKKKEVKEILGRESEIDDVELQIANSGTELKNKVSIYNMKKATVERGTKD